MAKTKEETTDFKGDDEVDYSSFGLSQEQETDRYKIGDTKNSLEPMRIVRVRFDEKTRYYNKETEKGTPIVKIDGISMDDKPVKYFSFSNVLYKNMQELIEVIKAREMKDEDTGILWYVFPKKVKINGFELVKTKKDKNPYVKIKLS